jgi:hypothetical protein
MTRDPKFFISADPEKCFTYVILEGFLEPDEIADFAEKFKKAKASLLKGPQHHLTLIDIVAFKIQSQMVAEGFAAMMSDPAIRSQRLAFVAGDSPVRLQLRRMLHENSQIFPDRSSAEDWLFGQD